MAQNGFRKLTAICSQCGMGCNESVIQQYNWQRKLTQLKRDSQPHEEIFPTLLKSTPGSNEGID